MFAINKMQIFKNQLILHRIHCPVKFFKRLDIENYFMIENLKYFLKPQSMSRRGAESLNVSIDKKTT